MPQNTRPTLQTIAEICGVTKTTVSLALRKHPRITEKTRLRVLEAAERVNYKTNPLVAAHMSMVRSTKTPSYTATLGIVSEWPLKALKELDDPTEPKYRLPSFSLRRHVDGIRQRATELGFHIDYVSLSETGMTGRRASDILKNRGISGLIALPIVSDQGTLDLEWENFASVAIGYSMRSPIIDRACNDNYSGTRNAVKFLDQQGFKRIGMVIDTHDDIRVRNLWTSGYLSEFRLVSPKLQPMLLEDEDLKLEQYQAWLEKEKPEVVIATSNKIVQWSRKLGYDLPNDLSVVTMESTGNISGYDQAFERVGAAAADKVINLLLNNETGLPSNPTTLMTQSIWRKGKTLKLTDPNAEPNFYGH